MSAEANLNQMTPEQLKRNAIALGASGELEALMEVIIKQCGPDTANDAIRGIAMRARSLAGFVMSAIGDEAQSTEELARNLYGFPQHAIES